MLKILLFLGDALIFKPTEAHCVSSRCRDREDVYCLSSYVKSSVVSGNDAEQIITKKTESLSSQYFTLK